MVAPQWQSSWVLSKAEGPAQRYAKSKVQWLNVFVAACTGQISVCTCGSARTDEVELRLCVCIRIRTSQEACTGGWLCVPAPGMDDVAAGRFGVGQEQQEGHCALQQHVSGISTFKRAKDNLPLPVITPKGPSLPSDALLAVLWAASYHHTAAVTLNDEAQTLWVSCSSRKLSQSCSLCLQPAPDRIEDSSRLKLRGWHRFPGGASCLHSRHVREALCESMRHSKHSRSDSTLFVWAQG